MPIVKIAGWILFGLFALIAIVFASNNFRSVALDLWPLPFLVEMPMFLMTLGTLFVGFLGGLCAAWFAGARRRRRVREQQRQIRTLKSELEESRTQPKAIASRADDRAA